MDRRLSFLLVAVMDKLIGGLTTAQYNSIREDLFLWCEDVTKTGSCKFDERCISPLLELLKDGYKIV